MTTHVNRGLDYRPATYFWAQDLKVQLPSDISGAERRRLYKLALEAGDDTSLFLQDPDFSAGQLDRNLRGAWGAIHPSHLGGEYLPRRRSEEVEIARIVIDSTTRDVISVSARRGKNRIYYRVVDEYDGDTLGPKSTRTSKQPLTLGELVDFFLGGWDLLDCLHWNFEGDGFPRRAVHRFLLEIESDFYVDFDDEVRCRVDDWLETKAQSETEEED